MRGFAGIAPLAGHHSNDVIHGSFTKWNEWFSIRSHDRTITMCAVGSFFMRDAYPPHVQRVHAVVRCSPSAIGRYCIHTAEHTTKQSTGSGSLILKVPRWIYTDSVLTFSELSEQSDEQLFSRVACSNHCLFHLFEKDKSQSHMSLFWFT